MSRWLGLGSAWQSKQGESPTEESLKSVHPPASTQQSLPLSAGDRERHPHLPVFSSVIANKPCLRYIQQQSACQRVVYLRAAALYARCFTAAVVPPFGEHHFFFSRRHCRRRPKLRTALRYPQRIDLPRTTLPLRKCRIGREFIHSLQCFTSSADCHSNVALTLSRLPPSIPFVHLSSTQRCDPRTARFLWKFG